MRPTWTNLVSQMVGALAVLSLAALFAWMTIDISRQSPASGLPAPPAMKPCILNGDGILAGRLYGSLETEIYWRGAGLRCDGMARPDGAGVRLVFAPADAITPKLVFVIGIDGGPEDWPGSEHGATITIIDEGRGRFFSSGGMDRCWTRILAVEPLDGPSGAALQIDGEVYCAGAIPALNQAGSVTLGEFRYSGRLRPEEAESQ